MVRIARELFLMPVAYSYIRFSTPAQQKGDSLRRQLKKAERFSNERGLTLDTSLRDLGVSGYRGDNRRKGTLARFLQKVRDGEIARDSWLIVENIDRLSRENPWDALGLFREIIEAGLTVASLIDEMIYDLVSLRARPEMMQTLNAALTKAHRESADKADRLQEVWAEKRAEIEAGGRRKLTRQGPGWVDLIADDPAEPLVGEWRLNDRAPVVREIFQWAIGGLGKESIVRRLNARGTPSFKYGDGWNASVVAVLLSDRRTIGELQLFTKVGGPRRAIGAPIQGYFPSVINEDDFFRAQAAISKRHSGATPGKKGKVPNLFVGIARCLCGRAMEFRDKQSRRAPSPKSVYLTCSGNRRGHKCLNSARFTYSELEGLVLDWVSDIKMSDAEMREADSAATRLSAKEAKRDDLKRRISEGMEKWGISTVQIIKDELFAIVERDGRALEAVEAEIVSLAEIVRSTKGSAIDDRRASVRRLREEMGSLDGEAFFDARAKLAAALRAVIDRAEFHPDGTFGITLTGGLRLYTFAHGKLIGTFDLTAVNPDGADNLLTFPQAKMIDDHKLHPMTLSGIREALVALSTPIED